MGKGRVPWVQELVNESRDRYAYIVYLSTVVLGTLSFSAGWFEEFRIVEAIAVLATPDIARALYHAAHPVLQKASGGTPQSGKARGKSRMQVGQPWRRTVSK